MSTVRRALTLLVLIAAATLVSACTPAKPQFESVDITGAEYARDFHLNDVDDHPRQLSDYRGKVVVLFFGYTQCPDICPTTMVDLKAVMQAMGADADRVQVLFVTLDPVRDTPALLKQYVPSFDSRFVGLRGDEATTAQTAKDFKVFYQRVDGPNATSYTYDHTAGSYVFDPSGRIRLFLRQGQTVGAVAHDLKLLLS